MCKRGCGVWRGKVLGETGFVIPPEKHEGRGAVFQKYSLC